MRLESTYPLQVYVMQEELMQISHLNGFYINVDDIKKSIHQCIALGGKVLIGIKMMVKQGKYCVIEDPAGAVAALFEWSK